MSSWTGHWYPELSQVFRLPGSLAFSYVGALHRTPTFPDDLLAPAPRPSDVGRFRLDDAELLDSIRSAPEGFVAVIDPESGRMSVDQAEERLSNLRPLIQEVRTRRISVWFLSSKPLHCYPALAGSSILADAETVRAQPLSRDAAISLAVENGATDESAARVAEFSGGSRALLSAFLEIEFATASGNEKVQLAKQLEAEIARETFEQLGADLSALLEAWAFEHKMTEIHPDDVPNESILSALICSGVLRRSENDSFALFPFRNRQTWLDSLASWIASVIEPPESWSKVAAELFALERDIRHELGKRFELEFGPEWRGTALADEAGQILELARRDGIPAATALSDLRGPLDWVQLSQLLELASRLANTSAFLGLRPSDWERVGRDVLAIRHRVAHMRLVRAGDLEKVRSVRRMIQIRRLTAT